MKSNKEFTLRADIYLLQHNEYKMGLITEESSLAFKDLGFMPSFKVCVAIFIRRFAKTGFVKIRRIRFFELNSIIRR